MQHSLQSGSTEYIDLRETWFTPDVEEYPIKTPAHVPIVTPENNIYLITLSQSTQQVQESEFNKGFSVSEVIERPVSEGI